MIVPMQKITVMVQAKDAQPAVEKMRSLGVVHVEHFLPPQGKEISVLKEEEDLVSQALRILSLQTNKSTTAQETPSTDDWKAIARHIIDSHKRIEQLEEYSRSLKASVSQWEGWGDFDPQAIRHLAQAGLEIKLFQLSVKEIKNIPEGIVVEKIKVRGGIANCMLISQGKIDIPFREVPLPKMGLSRMRQRIAEDNQVISGIKKELEKYFAYKNYFLGKVAWLRKELEFREALAGMGSEEKITFIKGYIPYDEVGLVEQTAKKEKWGLVVDAPSEADNIPTLIRNPRWVSLIAPVFKAMEIIPGYRELDISLWFLIFLSIFFGILIGDAGYGLIYIILTLYAQRKIGRRLAGNSIFTLFYILSGSAVVWGLLSGTIFGQEWLPGSIKPLLPALRNDKTVQSICFFLGALHLSLAHFWRAVLKTPSLTALADIGWMSILWGSFFLARVLILGYHFPFFAKWFFIIGPALVILFSSPKRNILKGVAGGLGNFSLSFVNCFTDVVSYIRLFAVGLATVTVADSFNKMALGIGFSSFLSSALTSLILILGHGLNIVLGPLAVLVHGVRLNVLEFCNHADIKWSGFSYKPLKD